ncbi:class I SAM-dependent methyltransferase [Teredinibacter waterburyi]|uniref:class I SAM-dependent methyltransferase n=1 Tax=Teredinibacter waterburyi TaxID=1500538 RepID=UPI0016600072|nr:class I SAM-dependent methyltransferase [Teredinibacter waterburyi]
MSQTWSSVQYEKNARFVSDLGMPVVTLLAPKAGERILDLGCGDGVLTKKIQDMGCDLVGVDASAEFIESALALGINANQSSAYDIKYEGEFDAVFSNAALHWMKDADLVCTNVYRSLKKGGRFVAECGGFGCVDTIRTALLQELEALGHDGTAFDPWYFPTVEQYSTHLESAGFKINSIALIPRPTPLPGDVLGWLETFSKSFLAPISENSRTEFLERVRTKIMPKLFNSESGWTADYIRLRFEALK